MSASILVVEDEPGIQELLKFNLGHHGHDVTVAVDAEEAAARMRDSVPDLILLDWMLPGASGIELARRVRADQRLKDVPIIMLTARGDERDKILGLETGTDDYITKPFSPRELMARIKAVLRRRAPQMTEDTAEIAGLRLDPLAHRVFGKLDGADRALDLGPTEFRLLHFLMTHAERVDRKSTRLNSSH